MTRPRAKDPGGSTATNATSVPRVRRAHGTPCAGTANGSRSTSSRCRQGGFDQPQRRGITVAFVPSADVMLAIAPTSELAFVVGRSQDPEVSP
jgi:hypothetical protein